MGYYQNFHATSKSHSKMPLNKSVISCLSALLSRPVFLGLGNANDYNKPRKAF